MEEIKKTIFKDIYIVINKIRKCKSKSEYTILINELYTLYNLCDEYSIDDYPKLEDYSVKSIEYINKELDFVYQVLSNYDYHLEFSKNYKNINNDRYLNPNTFVIHNYFDSTKHFDIVEDFLNEYDPKLLEIFYELLDEGRILTLSSYNRENEDLYTPAFTTCSYGSYKPYIIVRMENCIPDLINIVHELGHAKEYMNASVTSKKIWNQREYNCLTEVYSHFLQNLFIRYLEKIKFNLKDVNTSKLGYNYTFYHWIKKLNDSLENHMFPADMVNYLNYTYGIALSYHFIDRYIKDSEKTKKEIDDFIIFNGQYEFLDLLEKFNLKDEIIDSKVLKKYI